MKYWKIDPPIHLSIVLITFQPALGWRQGTTWTNSLSITTNHTGNSEHCVVPHIQTPHRKVQLKTKAGQQVKKHLEKLSCNIYYKIIFM